MLRHGANIIQNLKAGGRKSVSLTRKNKMYILNPSLQQLTDCFNDITAPRYVQVQIRADRKVVWINVDNVCVLRICEIPALLVDDQSASRNMMLQGDVEDYRLAPSGEGPLADTWKDKPHRLIYDLVNEVKRLKLELADTH